MSDTVHEAALVSELRQSAKRGAGLVDLFEKVHRSLELSEDGTHQLVLCQYIGIAFIKGVEDAMLLKRITASLSRQDGKYIVAKPEWADEMMEMIRENESIWGDKLQDSSAE